MKKLSRALGYLLMCIMLLTAHLPRNAMAAQETGRSVIRVGFFAFEGYHELDENGQRSGYGYELLQHLAAYTNWRIEYVGYDQSWSDMLRMLAEGRIDLVTSAQKTAERTEAFDFSDDSIGTSAAILTVRAGDNTYSANDYAAWSGIRVGLLRDSSRNQALSEFALANGFDYQPVYYSTTDELVEALHQSNDIDAILTSNLRLIHDEWILAQFDPSPFYIIVQKGNAALLSEINNALEHMYNTEPELRTELMRTYYGIKSGDSVAFTAEERAWRDSMSG